MRIPLYSAGFTLIEMIVSLGVFSIVVTTAIGAMFVVLSTNQQLQSEQNVMTNLGFALDGMTREIRTGFNYYCASASNYGAPTVTGSLLVRNIFNNARNIDDELGDRVSDCATGRAIGATLQGVAFFEGGMSITGTADRILYFYDATAKTIMRRVGGGAAQSIISSGLVIEDVQFYVTGSNTLRELIPNADQPTVTIYIEARESAASTAKTYKLQTTVTQRTLDL